MPLERDLVDGDPWVFDGAVAAEFETMLERSVPGYVEMRKIIRELAEPILARAALTRPERRPRVLDLGCSDGLAALSFVNQGYELLGLESSAPMAQRARDRYRGLGRVTIVEQDLREGFPRSYEPDVILCVLTLGFVPARYRPAIMRAAYDALAPGGALFLVEKTVAIRPDTQDLLTAAHHSRKRLNGYTSDEIKRKRLALDGILFPLSAGANERMLASVGFYVEPVWRSLNFAAWMAQR